MSKRWTEHEDNFLMFYGHCLTLAFGSPRKGYGYVSNHDLGRSEDAGLRRIAWLRKHRPALVAETEARAVAE